MKRYPSDPCLYHDNEPLFAPPKEAVVEKREKPEQDQTKWEAAMRTHLGDSFKEGNGRGLDLSIKNSPFLLMKAESAKSGGVGPGDR